MPGLAQDAVMNKSELKALLLNAKMKPVSCAFGITKDRSAVILLSKTQNPKLIEATLKRNTDITTSRFGHVSVDDANLVTFSVSKSPPPGIERQLLMALKGTGFMNVNCIVEDGAD